MGKIIKIKGNVKQESDSEVLLFADEQCIFGIDDLFDETGKRLEWFLKDEKGSRIFKKKGEWNDKILLAINKKLCGDYRYNLGASFKSISYPSIYIGGYCDPKITNAQTDLPQKVGCGIIKRKVTIEAEGLNGNTLDLELDFYDKCQNVSKKCVEGVAVFDISIDTTSFLAKLVKDNKKEIEKSLQIKIKNKAGKFIKNDSGSDVIIEQKITISTELKESPKASKNKTKTNIKPADKIKPEVNGIIELEKIAFTTAYNVCNDEYRNNNDLWILNGGNHWLKKRTDEDKKKPDPLPITLSSDKSIEMTVVFGTILEIDGITIRVRDKDGKYIFPEKPHTKKKKGEEFSVTFVSNSPAYGTVQYLDTFELIFDYSFDNTIWLPLGCARFCLYLTLNNPSYVSPLPNPSYINETLLWLTCDAAKGLSNKDNIVDTIFSKLKSLKVVRKREGDSKYLSTNLKNKGLGYWRGNSNFNNNFKLTGRIGTIDLLLGKYGEARCGEWADFFIYLCNTQGINNLISLPFYAMGMFNTYYPIVDLTAWGVNTSKSPHNSSGTEALIMSTPTGNLDHAIEYDEEISSAFLVKSPADSWQLVDGQILKQLKAIAQGNDNPLHMFWDHVFAVRTGRFYDPSYGVAGATSHGSKAQLMKEYARTCLAGVPMVAVPNPTSRIKGEKYKDKHTGKYVNFAIAYTFESNKNKVPGFTYKYITTNIDDKLYFT